MQVAAVVPTCDEAETIGPLVRTLDQFCDMVVVADGSNDDDTWTAAEDAGALVVYDHGGLGSSYREAWEQIPTTWHVLHIDAGGSHDPYEARDMIDLAAEGFDCVIGSRFTLNGKHLGSRRRRWSSKLASSALNLISLGDIGDWTSGFRVYSPRAREILRNVEFTTWGHAWQIEALWALRNQGMRVVEHGITYRPSGSHLSSQRVSEAFKLYWRLAAE